MSSSYASPIFNNAAYTNNSNTTSGVNSTKSSGTGALGESDFMTLLIAQLKNQDPLNPQDNTQFIAELANFTALQQQTTMTKTLQQSTAVSLIGTYVQDSHGNKGVVQSVSNDTTNGLQVTINTTQTNKDGSTSTVPVDVKFQDIINISNPNSVQKTTDGQGKTTGG